MPLALGTDTAGSGRVPAMYTNIVGLKPTLGLVSTAGMLPACRTLDCVSIFALTVADAITALDVVAGFDPADPYSRTLPAQPAPAQAPRRIGIARADQLFFDGDAVAAQAFAQGLERLRAVGADLVEIDIAPFLETARLLYEGPWLAERYIVVEDLMTRDPGALHPITRQVIEPGATPSAVDAFRAGYRLQELRARAAIILDGVDALCLPTAPRLYTRAEIDADNVRLNSRLGTYTNFVNLLDLCGLALPSVITPEGRPYGITLLARAGHDHALAALGIRFAQSAALPLGATGALGSSRVAAEPPAAAVAPGEIEIAVFGAHMSGLPLNRDLVALGGTMIGPIETAPLYRLFLLPGGHPRAARIAARRRWLGFGDRRRAVAAAGGRVRPLHRVHSLAARDRQGHARRRARGAGLPRRSRRRGGGARHHRVGRMARVPRVGAIRGRVSDRRHQHSSS